MGLPHLPLTDVSSRIFPNQRRDAFAEGKGMPKLPVSRLVHGLPGDLNLIIPSRGAVKLWAELGVFCLELKLTETFRNATP
jgi:hypothetical protein